MPSSYVRSKGTISSPHRAAAVAPPTSSSPMSERQQMALARQLSAVVSSGLNSPADSCSTAARVGSPTIQHRTKDRNERGETPLHIAAIRGDTEQVTKLLAQGADSNAVDFAGWSPLHEACNHGWYDIVVMLVNAGADVNAKGFDNFTPLHDAVINAHLKIVKLLVECGADTLARNANGKTPLDVASALIVPYLLMNHQQRLDLKDATTFKVPTQLTRSNGSKDDRKLSESENNKSVAMDESDEQKNQMSSAAEGAITTDSTLPSATDKTSSKEQQQLQDPTAAIVQPTTICTNLCEDPPNTKATSVSDDSSGTSTKRPFTEISNSDGGESGGSTVTGGGGISTFADDDNNIGPGEDEVRRKRRKEDVLKSSDVKGIKAPDRNTPSPKPTIMENTPPPPSEVSEDNMKSDLKVPPLKIVIPPQSEHLHHNQETTSVSRGSANGNGAAPSGTAQTGGGNGSGGPRNGKNSFQRIHHSSLPYVVSTTTTATAATMDGSTDKDTVSTDSAIDSGGKDSASGVNLEENTKSGGTSTNQRILRSSSHRSTTSQSTTTTSSSTNASPQPPTGAHSLSPHNSPNTLETACSNQTATTGVVTLQNSTGTLAAVTSTVTTNSATTLVATSSDTVVIAQTTTATLGTSLAASSITGVASPSSSAAGDSVLQTVVPSPTGTELSGGGSNNSTVKTPPETPVTVAGDLEVVPTMTTTMTTVTNTIITATNSISTSSSNSTITAASTTSTTTTTAVSNVDVHPRKRKMRPKGEVAPWTSSAATGTIQIASTINSSSTPSALSLINTVAPASAATTASTSLASTLVSQAEQTAELSQAESPVHPHDQPITNCYQLYLDIRKQIEKRRRGLFPVQPKPPQGFKDYLMNRCTYLLASNAPATPNIIFPSNLAASMKELFSEQEKERYRLRMQHVIEKEKLVLAVEQEILRVHGRAARALANQSLPFSACTILRDEEVYNLITPEQEEKDRNARSRYNGRLFLSWLQDVDDKWEKIKEHMLLRHHNEAESLYAVQKMNWEWKMKEKNLCDRKTTPTIEEQHVPMVHVSDDFDLLPA